MSKRKALLVLLALVVLMLATSGCYYRKQVESSEVGLVMDDGVAVTRVVGPGRYTDMGYYAELKVIDATAKTVGWDDPDLVTKDKQPIGLSVSVTYARDRGKDAAKHMWEFYNSEAVDDTLLRAQVLNRIPRSAKAVTTKHTLDDMLGISGGGREEVQKELFDLLSDELAEIDAVVLDVGINNIAPSADFMQLLEDKANAAVEREVAKEKALTAVENLKKEEAETDIQVEYARRNRLIAEEAAKIYETNPEWFELKKLEALAGVIGANDKFYFIDPNTDVTLLLGAEGVVPLGE